MAEYRVERDSLGDVFVPSTALYGAQTQRAVDNFPVSGITFLPVFVRALGLIKEAAAEVNLDLGLLDPEKAIAIRQAAGELAEGRWYDQFPLDIFQTGSGTSTNMNANEVIANRATQILGGELGSKLVHPNDHVNMCQSSNDVIPTAVHVSAFLQVQATLLPGIRHLQNALEDKAVECDDVIVTGRTHLMDAMPIRLSQELGGWAYQMMQGLERIEGCLPRLAKLAIGGTAVGTGLNAHPEFGGRVVGLLAERTKLPFVQSDNYFPSLAALDTATELSGQLKTTATALMKIANDLRWMNSGPNAGLAEIVLPALQPGSSIMAAKINPVMCESVMMVCGQIIGNDMAVAIGNERGNFQLNVMIPLIAHNLLESITILGNAAGLLADKAIRGFTVNREHSAEQIDKNPILVTALNPVIGYDRAAQIAKRAFVEGRRVKDVAFEMTDLSQDELDRLLDPRRMTEGGILSP